VALNLMPTVATGAFAGLVVAINGIFYQPFGPLAALLCSALLYRFLTPADGRFVLIALVWAMAAAQFILARGFHKAILWASSSQQRAALLVTEARERRGELRRTLHSLTEATQRLERLSHELAIARKQADEARHIKTQFAANISHELRTPLNLIIGFSEMMYRTPEVYKGVRWVPALRADIREIYRSARHLMDMVNDILDLSRVEADKLPLRLEITRIEEVANEAIETVRGLLRGKEVVLRLDMADDLPSLLIDRARVRQVLINLLNNAIRFTDEGSITVRAYRQADEVVVAVTDTGVGIPEDQLSVIFEQFGQATGPVTSGRGGIGLGLAICRQFVRLHGGRIEAESQVGVGSTFRFYLPIGGVAAGAGRLSYYAPSGWSPKVPENPLGKTVLVLAQGGEDTPIVRNIPGYRSILLDSLDGLADLVEAEHPAGLVVLQSPYDATPIDLQALWQAAGRDDLPIVRCELPLHTLQPEQLGVSAYLSKPVQAEQLVAAIRRAREAPKRFLVVDDDAGFVSLLNRTLMIYFPDADVERAYTGEEALRLLEAESFDVVLLDILLPLKSGLDVVHEIREKRELTGTIFILMTGSSYLEDLAETRPARLEVIRQRGDAELGRYLGAVLDVAPPNFASSIPAATRREPVVETPAS
ncbi:MAG: hybrid sensor histidine kinase/response regulator, partial [Chloroflexi bacterium]|nr:hybrid sensor histidine kinase/response regulator [Chloroflexota bacterium]